MGKILEEIIDEDGNRIMFEYRGPWHRLVCQSPKERGGLGHKTTYVVNKTTRRYGPKEIIEETKETEKK